MKSLEQCSARREKTVIGKTVPLVKLPDNSFRISGSYSNNASPDDDSTRQQT
jgi:hypothetical protein